MNHPLEPRRDAERVVLASTSPGRSALLSAWGVRHDVVDVHVDEVEPRGAIPERAALGCARTNALAKWRAAHGHPATAGRVVLAADTLIGRVVCRGLILHGKPADVTEARTFLGAGTSAAPHLAVTAVVAGRRPGAASSTVATTKILWRRLEATEIERYLASGAWRGRAGALDIMGASAGWVAAIDGEIETVAGLPRAATLALLDSLNRRRERNRTQEGSDALAPA